MNKDFKKQLSNFLDYLEDKTDPVYADEVSKAIKKFKQENSITWYIRNNLTKVKSLAWHIWSKVVYLIYA